MPETYCRVQDGGFRGRKEDEGTDDTRDRLKALFVIDGICAQAKEVKEQLQARFSRRMKQICGLLDDVEGEERNIFAQIVSTWRRSGVFTDSVLPKIQANDSNDTFTAPPSSSVASSSSSKDKESKRESAKIKQRNPPLLPRSLNTAPFVR